MKKLLTLFFALAASITFASATIYTSVLIDGLCYDLDDETLTATLVNNKEAYKSLTSIVMPDTVVYNEQTFDVTAIANSAFGYTYNEGITQFVIGNKVQTIGEGAFRGCQSVKSFVIPNSVKTIGSNAFYKCYGLTTLVIGDSVEYIGAGAFYECDALSSVTFGKCDPVFGVDLFKYCTSLPVVDGIRYAGDYLVQATDKSQTTYTIQPNTRWIGNRAFVYCNSMTSIVIPDSVSFIGNEAFDECEKLQSVNIPAGVKYIGSHAFQLCKVLPSVVLPEGLTYIGVQAFSGCAAFTHMEVPSTVTYLGNNAFEYDLNLTSITLHCPMDTLPEGIFIGCASLDSVVVPQGVKTIDQYAFMACSALTHVELPEGLKSILQDAFSECPALKEIELPASLDTIGQYVFKRSASSLICKAITPPRIHEDAFAYGSMHSLQVPKQSLEAYKAADVWKNFYLIWPIYGEEEEAAFAGWTKYDNAHFDNSCGMSGETFNWGIMIPTDSIRGNKLTQVALFETRYNSSEITLSVVSGGETPASGQLLHTESFMPEGNGFHIIAFENPIVIDPTQNLWIYFSEGTDEQPAAMDYTAGNPNAQWIGFGTEWMNLQGQWSSPFVFMIRAHIPSTEGVENVQNDKAQSTKILRDGQILILRNGKTYNAVGAEIKN